MHERRRGRQRRRVKLVVVRDDQLHPQRPRMLRHRHRRDPAVHRYHQRLNLLRREPVKRLGVQPVTICQTVRYVRAHPLVPQLPQRMPQDRRGGHPVHVVVAVHHHRLLIRHRLHQPLRRRHAPRKLGRILQILQPRIHKPFRRLIIRNAAQRQQPPQKRAEPFSRRPQLGLGRHHPSSSHPCGQHSNHLNRLRRRPHFPNHPEPIKTPPKQ